jgi:hypothetical protein
MLAYAFVYFHKLLIYSVLYYSRSYYAMYSLKRDHTFYNVLVSNCLHSRFVRVWHKKSPHGWKRAGRPRFAQTSFRERLK